MQASPRFDELRPVADINVTPFIDVVLVLLIVFMVTAPLAVSQIPLRLPQSQARATRPPSPPVVVSLTLDGRLFLDSDEVPEADLERRVRALVAADAARVFQVRADEAVPYRSVMALLALLGSGGASQLSLLAQPLAP